MPWLEVEMPRSLKLVEAASHAANPAQRTALCQRWLAIACSHLRRRLQTATQVRQALAAGLTQEEARLSVEPALADIARFADELADVRKIAKKAKMTLPIEILTGQGDLDALDREILILAVAPHVDVEIRDAVARFNDNLLANYVDVRLCLEFLVDDPVARLNVRNRFGNRGRLIQSRFVSMERPRDVGGENLLAYEVLPAARVMQLLLGELGLLDSAMGGMAKFERPEIELSSVILPPDDLAPMISLLEQHTQNLSDEGASPFALPNGLTVEISGPPGTGKSLLVRGLCNHLGLPLLEIDAARLQEMPDEAFRSTLYSALDQATLGGAIVVLDGVDALLAKGSGRVADVQAMLQSHRGITILTARESGSLDTNLDRFVVQRLLIEVPDTAARQKIFELHLPEGVSWGEDCKLQDLAGVYTFPGALIRNAVQVAVNRAYANDPKKLVITHDILRSACHEQIRATLEEYAVRRRVDLTLEDLILPKEAAEDIQELFTAAKHRAHVLHSWGFDAKMSTGKGLVAMFSGEPGTGKTMCATILANEMDQELYQISIPRVVSKWIGETEKNIEKIFHTARANHGMLLFDEADSLFAKRTKVESSVDRYSNMATNMLLQEIENFEGIVILTTNIEKNIDKAFRRRIGFKIHFPFPKAEMREKIWQALIPKLCPVDSDVDWEEIGKRFELSGGHIKNAVLRAAYQAAAAATPLQSAHLEYAARQECKNAGRVFRAFGDYDPLSP
jgi:SpoVK/Ycf46/Vps4 family AAA+-type ATPase